MNQTVTSRLPLRSVALSARPAAGRTAFESTTTHLLDLLQPRSATLAHAILAGFIASLALLVVFGVAYVVALALGAALPSGVPGLSTLGAWARGLTRNPLLDRALPNPFVAGALFSTGGILWAILYASVFEPRLRGPDWQRGLIFALVPWAFSLGVFMPFLGGGLFGLGLGAGPLPIIGNLALHAVYGVVLARLYGPLGGSLDGEECTPSEMQLAAWAACESAAVRGLGVGVALGLALGGTGLLVGLLSGASPLLGTNPVGLLLAAMLSGASIGASAGALLGGQCYDS